MISKKNKVSNQLTDHLGNVRAVVSKDNNGNAAALVSATDYYPFGMPMPNRQIVGGEPYRYAYQGQEIDPETGKEAFQLRLWDSRIGRWLTTDPYRQYHSPYVGMGNDPINGIDPDGGFKWKWFAKLVNFAIGGDGVQWSKSREEFFVSKWSTTGDGGILLENFFKSPIEFYANANGKVDFGLQAGRNSFTNLISFGSGSVDDFGGITRATTAIPRTANNVANLDQIAQVLLQNPGSTVFLRLVLPKLTTSRGARDAATYNRNRFQQFARELRNRGVPVNSIKYSNVPVTGIPHNINVIDLNIR